MEEPKITIKLRTTKYGRKQTVIEIPGLDHKRLNELLREFKRKLGTGGFIEDDKIVLRGDMRNRVWRVLEQWDIGEPRRKVA